MGTLIVTGASRGIGAATAILAAEAGWDVVVNYRGNADAAASVVSAIKDGGGRAITVRGDVSSEAEVVSLFDAAESRLGPVTALVNNAGILHHAAPVADIDVDRWQQTMDTNLRGAFLCAREAVRRMALSRGGAGGCIVNLSSMAAILGGAGEFVDYAMSKGGVDALTIGLGKEVAADGIRVNGVRPGLIDTDIHASTGDPGRAQRLASGVPMQRIGTAREVAGVIVWLLSDEASYMTATTLTVSGGR